MKKINNLLITYAKVINNQLYFMAKEVGHEPTSLQLSQLDKITNQIVITLNVTHDQVKPSKMFLRGNNYPINLIDMFYNRNHTIDLWETNRFKKLHIEEILGNYNFNLEDDDPRKHMKDIVTALEYYFIEIYPTFFSDRIKYIQDSNQPMNGRYTNSSMVTKNPELNSNYYDLKPISAGLKSIMDTQPIIFKEYANENDINTKTKDRFYTVEDLVREDPNISNIMSIRLSSKRMETYKVNTDIAESDIYKVNIVNLYDKIGEYFNIHEYFKLYLNAMNNDNKSQTYNNILFNTISYITLIYYYNILKTVKDYGFIIYSLIDVNNFSDYVYIKTSKLKIEELKNKMKTYGVQIDYELYDQLYIKTNKVILEVKDGNYNKIILNKRNNLMVENYISDVVVNYLTNGTEYTDTIEYLFRHDLRKLRMLYIPNNVYPSYKLLNKVKTEPIGYFFANEVVDIIKPHNSAGMQVQRDINKHMIVICNNEPNINIEELVDLGSYKLKASTELSKWRGMRI